MTKTICKENRGIKIVANISLKKRSCKSLQILKKNSSLIRKMKLRPYELRHRLTRRADFLEQVSMLYSLF